MAMINEGMLPTRFDHLFIKNLEKTTNEKEMKEIVELLDMEKHETLTDREYEKIEIFFIKIKKVFGSLYESILGIAKIYDIDVELLIKNKRILKKLQAERFKKKKAEGMEEYF